MVKKSSLLNKLWGRWRSPSGMRVESSDRQQSERTQSERTSAPPPRPTSRRVEPVAPPPAIEPADAVAQPMPERTSSRKMSPKEEALVTMEGGLKDLANLMRGVQVRMDAEGTKVAEMAGDIRMLPALGQAQLDVLRALAEQVEKQGRANAQLMAVVGDLPGTMSGLRSTLDRMVATDERSAKTLDEFRSTMGTIQASMQEMVGHSKKQADHTEELLKSQDDRAERLAESLASVARHERDKTDKLAASLEQNVQGQREQTEKLAQSMESAVSFAVQGATRDADELRGMVKGLARSHDDSVSAMRLASEDQATRLSRMVEDGTAWNKRVLLLLALVCVALVAVAGALLLK